jgi:hypothetical protein
MSECSISGSPVLTIPELLEPILVCLDMRSLLTSAPRVCRQWRDLIQGSKLLQKALFFEWDEQLAGSGETRFNPLLVELFPILFDFDGVPGRAFNDLRVENLPIGRRRIAFYRRNASWRRMHIRQPPVKHVGLWTLDVLKGRKETMRMVKYNSGLKMEGFYSLVLKHVYWWDLFVAWGGEQGRRLPHFRFVRAHMVEWAEEMVQTADLVIGAFAADYCVDEGNARRSLDGSGLVKMEMGRPLASRYAISTDKKEEVKGAADCGLAKLGIFWFKAMDINGSEVIWKRLDGAFCCQQHSSCDLLPYVVPL